jgi:hypothetical protein
MPLSLLSAAPLLASLVLSYRAGPGTVYVAADSRLTSPERTAETPAETPSDSACKIRVLKDGVVFAGSGNAIFSTPVGEANIYAIAAKTAATLPPGPLQASDVRRIALQWQSTVHARLLARESPATQSAAETPTGSTGSFYAALEDGAVYSITLRVAADPHGVLRDIEEPETPSGYLTATGTNEAKHDALAIGNRQSAGDISGGTLPWPLRLRAIEAQTIQIETHRYGQNSEIGGPIDVVEITSKGPLWLARKAGCR